MRKNNILSKLINRLQALRSTLGSDPAVQQDRIVMGKLLQMIDNTDEVELTCDEVFALLDHYVELEARGEDAARLIPLISDHLDKCHDCFEEYEALSRVLAAAA